MGPTGSERGAQMREHKNCPGGGVFKPMTYTILPSQPYKVSDVIKVKDRILDTVQCDKCGVREAI